MPRCGSSPQAKLSSVRLAVSVSWSAETSAVVSLIADPLGAVSLTLRPSTFISQLPAGGRSAAEIPASWASEMETEYEPSGRPAAGRPGTVLSPFSSSEPQPAARHAVTASAAADFVLGPFILRRGRPTATASGSRSLRWPPWATRRAPAGLPTRRPIARLAHSRRLLPRPRSPRHLLPRADRTAGRPRFAWRRRSLADGAGLRSGRERWGKTRARGRAA